MYRLKTIGLSIKFNRYTNMIYRDAYYYVDENIVINERVDFA